MADIIAVQRGRNQDHVKRVDERRSESTIERTTEGKVDFQPWRKEKTNVDNEFDT